MKAVALAIALLTALAGETRAQPVIGDFYYQTNADGATATIVYYNGSTAETLYIPSEIAGLTVTSIDGNVFADLGLSNIVVPSTVTNIGNYAFGFNPALNGVYFQGNAPAVAATAFYGDQKATVYYYFGNGWSTFQQTTGVQVVLLEIGASPVPQFYFNLGTDNTATLVGYVGSFSSLTIPTNIGSAAVTDIGANAFNEDLANTAPSNLVIPDCIVDIEPYGLSGDYDLVSITIGSGVTNIGSLGPSYALNSINVSPQNRFYSSLDGILFNKDQTTLLDYPCAKSASNFTVPGTVSDIADFAFGFSSALTAVFVPDGVTNIGVGAFYGCSSLTNFIFPPDVTSIQGSTFNGCGSLTNFVIPNFITNIGGDAFEACTSLGSVIIPTGVSSIGNMTFDNCSRLTNIIIPPTVTSIGTAAFYQCWGLTTVEIPDSVTNIDWDAFHYCNNLTNIIIGRGMATIAPYAFQYCSSLVGILFLGNAPSADPTSFGSPNVAYYMGGTTGWPAFSATTGIPSVLWNPIPNPTSIGVLHQSFGFSIMGNSNIPVTIGGSTNLVEGNWLSLQTLNLTNGLYYFSDPQWTNYPARYYRISFR